MDEEEQEQEPSGNMNVNVEGAVNEESTGIDDDETEQQTPSDVQEPQPDTAAASSYGPIRGRATLEDSSLTQALRQLDRPFGYG